MSKLTRVRLENFTAFSSLDETFSSGVNVIIGTNGTGKTHLLKVLYAACAVTTGEDSLKGFATKLLGVFNPYQSRMTRLIRRQQGLPAASVTVRRDDGSFIKAIINNQRAEAKDVTVTGEKRWQTEGLEAAYIPVKEMLAHSPGFLSTASKREIAFEDVYVDIIKKAYLPKLRGKVDAHRSRLLSLLQKAIDGKVIAKNEHFFLKNAQGDLEFSLLAEGMRKLALVWLLIQNGTLLEGSVLFWDEPEANLNPALMGEVVEVILELQRLDVQVFLTTHNYVLLKEFDLRRKDNDALRFISLYRDENKDVASHATDDYSDIEPNALAGVFTDLYDREIERSFGDM
ncbi:AAA family ATPase [Janthinobacterium sp.]|uniref:AAA family ATPase n=1 Tax=Janthinobacterium sp. TaxID=1871054 RepID=UPI0025C6F3F9|nr:AAA family ATPase [Janthinobacterium sp.]NBV17565.1 AAA family ATPase [Janthinobacterium sp.]